MLESLRVKNFAIIEDAAMKFGPGLNVITGETGAGKSILVGALGLLLGERADKSMVRTGEKMGSMEAVFQLSDSSGIDQLLEDMGLEPLTDGVLIIRRTVPTSGSGRVFINDATSTVHALKKLGDLLVDLHGPHDHQSLLLPDFQLALLDSFGGLEDDRRQYEKEYRLMVELKSICRTLEGKDEEIVRRIDLLRYQIQEIGEAELGNTDEERLRKEHHEAANAQHILELAHEICQGLTEEEESIFQRLALLRSVLGKLIHILPEAVAWDDEAEGITIRIQELSDQIARRIDHIEIDPEKIRELEDRLSLLQKLERKYGRTVEEILQFFHEMEKELELLESREERLAEMKDRLDKQEKLVQAAGLKLGKLRRKTAGELARQVTKTLRNLGFPHGVFDIIIRESPPRLVGMDEIEFDFSPNKGEDPRPLRIIASSGEISRVMLAGKAVLAAHDRIPVLVFDEIDANLGGEMGTAVGKKLADVSQEHQVICITHLPQVAAFGQNHLAVSKKVFSGRTLTEIKPVDGETRIEEIARMLGGRDLTTVVLDHAREMLENIQ